MHNLYQKLKEKLLNKNIRAALYIIYFLFLYKVGGLVFTFFSVSELRIIGESHYILIKLEVYILNIYFGILGLVESTYGHIIYFTNGNSIHVLPGCSGLRPMYRILFILLLFPGPFKSKLWYIPFSMFLVLLAAVIHIIISAYVIIYLPEYYGVAHNYISRIIFYIVYFLIWVYWLEKFVLKKKKKDVVVKG